MTGMTPEEVLEQVKEAQRELRGLIRDARQAERDLHKAKAEVLAATTELLAEAIERIDTMTRDELARIAEHTQINIENRAKAVESFFDGMRLQLIKLPAELQIPGVHDVGDLVEVARQIHVIHGSYTSKADRLIESGPGVLPPAMERPRARRGKRR